jgi:hypothetical protein
MDAELGAVGQGAVAGLVVSQPGGAARNGSHAELLLLELGLSAVARACVRAPARKQAPTEHRSLTP